MSATDTFNLDISKLPSQVSLIKSELRKIGGSFGDISSQLQIFNDKGVVVEKVFKGVTKAGIAFSTTIKDIDTALPSVVQSASRLTKGLSDQERAIKAVNKVLTENMQLLKEEQLLSLQSQLSRSNSSPNSGEYTKGQQLKEQNKIIRTELQKYGASLGDLTGVTKKFNAETGQLLSKTFQGATKEGRNFKVVLSDFNKLFPSVGSTADEFTEKFKKIFSKDEINNEETKNLAKIRQSVEKEVEEESEIRINALREGLLKREAEKKRFRDKAKAADDQMAQYWEEKEKQKTITNARVTEQLRRQQQQANKKQTADLKAETNKRNLIRQKKIQEIQAFEKLSSENAASEYIRVVTKREARAQRIRLEKRRKIQEVYFERLRQNEKLENSYKKTGKAGAKSGDAILISWKSVVRLFSVQILHAAFANIRRLFSGATSDALEFSKRVAEVRTIIGDASETTEDWSRALSQLGQDLPFTQLQVAEAAYQALSNQVIKTVADLEFVREAGQLAIVGVSDIKTAVNALTSVMNAYGKGTYEAANISAVLFKSVELGRTRLSELEQNFGRLNILSSKLGVSLEEQQAAMTTLTVQGLKENVSKTLLVNVYNKLIRPSKRMKELFTEWGVASGEAAIKTFGLENVLNKFGVAIKQSGRGLEELGEIFKRIRATIGFMGIDTEKYAANLAKLNNAYDDYKKKVEEIRKTLGVSLQQELSRVNALMIRAGTEFLKYVNIITGSMGGMEAALKTVTRGLFDLSAALLIALNVSRISRWTTAMVTLTKAMWKFKWTTDITTVSLKTLGKTWPLLAVAGAVAIAEMVQNWLLWEERVRENIEKVRKEFQKLNERVIERSNKAITKWLKTMKSGLKEVFQPLRAVNVEISKMQESLEIDLVDSFKTMSERVEHFGKVINDAMKLDITSLKNDLRTVTKEIQDAERELERIASKKLSAEKDLRDRVFARGQIGRNIPEQAKQLERRARSRPVDQTSEAIKDYEEMLKLASQFENKLKTQATKYVSTIIQQRNNQIKALNKASDTKTPVKSVTSEQRDKLINQRLEYLKKSTNLDNERRRINDRIEILLRKQITALELQNKLKDDQKKKDETQEKSIQDNIKRKETAQKYFSDATRRLASFDIKAEQEKANKYFKIDDKKIKILTVRDALLRKLANQTRDIDRAAQDSGVDPQTRFNMLREIQTQRVNIYKDAENQITEITKNNLTQQRKEIEEDLNKQIKNRADAEAKRRDKILESEKTITTEISRIQANAAKIGTSSANETERKQISGFKQDLNNVLELNKEIKTLRTFEAPLEVINKKIAERAEAIKKVQRNLGISGGVFGKDRQLGNGVTADKASGLLTEALDNMSKAQFEYNKTTSQLGSVKDAIEQLNITLELNNLDQIKVDSPVKENTKSLQDLTNMMEDNIRATGFLYEGLTNKTMPQRHEQGGMINGPGGVDNVPAWLTSGEFVMNAQSTRRFLPELIAMNRPVQNFNKGGTVQNVSFGNINVTGGTSSRQTAKSIAREIKQEMRRGTFTFN